jgi:hypothetical protein
VVTSVNLKKLVETLLIKSCMQQLNIWFMYTNIYKSVFRRVRGMSEIQITVDENLEEVSAMEYTFTYSNIFGNMYKTHYIKAHSCCISKIACSTRFLNNDNKILSIAAHILYINIITSTLILFSTHYQ